MGNAGSPGAGADLGTRSRVRQLSYLLVGVATALGGLAFGAQPVAAAGTSACSVGASASWQPSGGRLELSIGGCAYQVTSAVDPYVITVTGPASYSRTVYQGDGAAPAGNVVLDDLAPGTYTITSSGVILLIDHPVYGSGSFSVQITAPVEISPSPSPAPATPPPSATLDPVATQQPAPARPRITKITPQNGARNISRAIKIRITFSMPVDGLVGIKDLTTGDCVPSRTSVDARTMTVTVTPRTRLAANHSYTLTVSHAVSIETGLDLVRPITIVFRTGTK